MYYLHFDMVTMAGCLPITNHYTRNIFFHAIRIRETLLGFKITSTYIGFYSEYFYNIKSIRARKFKQFDLIDFAYSF